MEGYCTNTEYTGSLGYNSVCYITSRTDVSGYGGKNVQVGSKVAKFSRKNQNVTLHLGTDGCH